jgi:hypothetical protein
VDAMRVVIILELAEFSNIVALRHFNDGADGFRGRTFGTGFAVMRRGRKEQVLFALH